MAFFTFFVQIFLLHTTPSGVYFNGKKYLHFVLNNMWFKNNFAIFTSGV